MSPRPFPAVRLANKYVHEHARHPDGVVLRRWRGGWYRWRSDLGCYTENTDEQIDSDLYRQLGLNTATEVRYVRHALLAVDHVLIDHVELGAWIDDERGLDPRDVAACLNGLVHLPSGETWPASPRYFATAALGAAYDPRAAAPEQWLGFLRELWPDDEESIAALQQWFGYLLTPDTRQQKILLVVGPRRSGKGTMLRVLRALLGAANVAAPTLASLGLPFGLWPLIGKTAAIIADARLGGRSDGAQIVERLLSISGEDAQTIDRKHRDHWHGTLSTRFAIVSNELPRFSDASDALAGRMLVLRLLGSWYGREDKLLTEKLLTELPGILNWAIEGWRQLRLRGHFEQPRSSASMIGELLDLGSPVAAWVRAHIDRDVRDRDRWVTCDDAYQAFARWCEREGVKMTPTQTVFGRDLRTVTGTDRVLVPRLIARTPRRVYAYMGLALRRDDQGDQGSEQFCAHESVSQQRNGANPDHRDHPAGGDGHIPSQPDLFGVPKPDDRA